MLQTGKYAALIGLVALAGACEVGSGNADALGPLGDGGGFAGEPVPPGSTLRAPDSAKSPIELSYGKNARIEVILEDEDGDPVANAAVRFALDGDAGGSSLQNVEVRTDAEGHASTLLTAGSVDSKFSVRASASGVQALFLPVEVRMEPRTALTVALAYEGDREVDGYVLRVFETSSCDDLKLGLPSDEPLAQGEAGGDDTEAVVHVVAGDAPLVLHVSALGSAGNVVASNCVPLGTLSGVDAAAPRASLEDTMLRIEGNYALLADLDVTVSADRLADALLDSQALTLPHPTAPNGDALLQAIQLQLAEAGQVADATWVAGERETLGAGLEDALADDERGLTVAADQLAEAVRAMGSQVQVLGVLSASGAPGLLELAYQPMELRAELQPGEPVTLLFGPDHDEPALTGTLGAAFDTTVSALEIDALRLELGLGEYGDALLYALADADVGLERAPLLDDVGCDTFAAWAATESELYDVCDDACLAAACERALDDLVDASAVALADLDTPHPALALRGDLPIYDFTGSGLAQKVATAPVTGSWGRAEGAIDPDPVTGSLGEMVY